MKTNRRFFLVLVAAAILFTASSCGAYDGGWMNEAPVNGNYDMNYGTPDDYQGEAGAFIENEFIKTAESAVSTFSADVDTASYTYFRRLVNSGYDLNALIDYAGSSLRTEEMINYFDYNYAGPTAGELFGVNVQIAGCPWNSEAVLMCLGLKADTYIPEGGNNLVFLIDVSGSMNSTDKLGLLKNAFSYLTEQLDEYDIVSIVTYSGKEEVVLEGCEGNGSAKILNAVNSLKASGSTNGQAGLQKAYEIAARYFIEGGNNRIIMASDGDLNVGISSPEELKNFVAEKRGEGIYLSVLGFGAGNYRDANMEALADNGDGVYYYIDSDAEARKVFGADLLGTLYTVAGDVKLQLTFDPDYIESYRLVGYENRLLDEKDFEDDTKDAGEVGAGHSVTVCYELILTEPGSGVGETKSLSLGDAGGAGWMTLAIRYKRPGESESRLNEYNIGAGSFTKTPDENFSFICAVTELSMMLHKSSYLGDIKIKDILAILDSLDIANDEYKNEFRELVRSLSK